MVISQPNRPGARAPRSAAALGAIVAAAMILVGLGAPAAQAADDPSVIFIGDSVTAGFGYFGAKENAKNITGSVNDEFPSSWYFGDNSLSDCSPADSGTPIDQCSNNNFNGAPWSAGPWQDGPKAPNVAYSYQIAKSQKPGATTPVENWAITGSTPAMWDTGGAFNYQLRNIKDTHVVMTLGANPILASFLKIRLSGVNVSNGACADSTEWLGWTGWWAYPPSYAVKCAGQQWTQEKQTEHLTSVYKTLLTNGNKVVAMGYYRACPWSFGVWQPNGNVAKGPASGNSCPSQVEKVSECSSCKVDGKTSQWDQAVAAQNEMNDRIAAAVASVQDWARGKPGVEPSDLRFVLPDQAAWAQHQAWDSESWVFKNDTWIHPSKAGHTQLAKTVTGAMCSSWGQWCGSQPAWKAQSITITGDKQQTVKGAVPAQAGNRRSKDLPSYTRQGAPISWTSRTRDVCDVVGDDVVTRRQDGRCRLRAFADGVGKFADLTARDSLRVR